jgi:hypothetical protein
MNPWRQRANVVLLLCALLVGLCACTSKAPGPSLGIYPTLPQEQDASPTQHVGPPQSVVIVPGPYRVSIRVGTPPYCAGAFSQDWSIDTTDFGGSFDGTQDYLHYHEHFYFQGDLLIYEHHTYKILALFGAQAVPICVMRLH